VCVCVIYCTMYMICDECHVWCDVHDVWCVSGTIRRIKMYGITTDADTRVEGVSN